MNNEPVPITEHLTLGTLRGSGVKYYMCENDNPNDSIVLTLIVHVGSLMENDDEQGLAHFIEHLGFKSTKSFEHYELVKFLESLGISYGPDLNASTHLLETVFRLNIKYDDMCSQISMGINVLSEWAYHMTISEKDVVEERQVISAEYIAKQGLGNRLLKKYWKSIFGSSESSLEQDSALLSRRFPIGIPEIFMHCDNEHIRKFYEKWYRPENMSVLVCGALHSRQNEVLDIMEKAFALPTPPEAPIFIPDSVTRCQQLQDQYLVLPTFPSKKDVVVAMVDPDLSSTQICFEFFSPVEKSSTINFIRQDILRRLMSSVLDKRFNELHKSRGNVPSDVINMRCDRTEDGVLTQKCQSPFLSVQISIREFVRGLICIGVSATLKAIDDDGVVDSDSEQLRSVQSSPLQSGVQSLLLEMKRLRCLGANSIELDNAKRKWLTFFTQQRNKHLVDNAYMITELQSYVLNGENVPFATPSSEAQICIEAIESITLEEMNDFLYHTFDMDVEENCSVYYDEATSKEGKCFRAFSGQFPKSIGDIEDNFHVSTVDAAGAGGADVGAYISEGAGDDQQQERLCRVLKFARLRVAALGALQAWPCNDHIADLLVVEFAHQALNACNESGGDCIVAIVEENVVEALECTEYVLSNGITVCCKWMPAESQGKVSMQGFALGGSSELTPVEDLLMSSLDELAGHSATSTVVANTNDPMVMEGKDVLELQSIANCRVNTQRHQHHRGIGGSTTSDKIELLLAFLVIKMTSQRIDRVHFDDWIEKKKSHLKNLSNSPEFAFMDRSRVLACGDEPNFRPVTFELLQEASGCYDLTCDMYEKAFMADPTEFSFVFTGDIGDKTCFKDLLIKYLGQLRPNSEIIQRTGKWIVDRGVKASVPESCEGDPLPCPVMHPFTLSSSSSVEIKSPIDEAMHLLNKDESKSSMMLIFRADMRSYLCDDADLVFSTALDAACRVLQVYLLDELRIKLGKVYNVNVEKSRSSLCTFFLISIGLHCQPSDVAIVQSSIKNVLRQLQNHGPEVSKLGSVAESMCKTHRDAATNSSYWLFWILDSYKAYKLHQWRHHQYPDQFESDTSCRWLGRNGLLRAGGKIAIIKENICCDSLREIYRHVFDMDKSISMKLLPELADIRDDCEEETEAVAGLAALAVGCNVRGSLVAVS